MKELLLSYDMQLFKLINQEWSTPNLDPFMVFITYFRETRYLLIALVVLLVLKYRMRAIKVILGCCLAAAISDLTAARVFKPLVGRTRPEFSAPSTRLLVTSQTSPSFPSNHAANTFAVANYLAYAAPALAGYAMGLAFIVSYSRIYVGVHYPLDVIGGAVLGALSAAFAYYLSMIALGFFGIKQERPLPYLPPAWKKKNRLRRRK